MIFTRPEDHYRLLTTLGIVILWSVPLNMLVSPLVDFQLVVSRGINWTVTMSAGTFLFTSIPLLVFVKKQLTTKREKRFFWVMAACFGCAFTLSLYFNSDLFYPVYGLTSWLGAALAGTVIYVIVRDGVLTPERAFRILTFGMLFTMVPMVLVIIDLDRYSELSASIGAQNILYGYENPRALGWISTIALSLLIAHAATGKSENKLNPALPLLVVVAATTLFWSGSRGGVFALSVGVATVLVMSRTRHINQLSIVLVCIMIGGFISAMLPTPSEHYGVFSRIFANLSETDANAISTGRLGLWRLTVSFITERPLTGYGAFPHKELGFTHGSAHNIILDAWLWFGIPVGTLALGFGVVFWFRILAIFRSADNSYLAAFFCVMTTLLAYSMVSGPYVRTFPVLLFAISAGILLGCQPPKSR